VVAVGIWWIEVARVAGSIAVAVELVGVRGLRAVVQCILSSVEVAIEPDGLAGLAHAVAVGVELIRVHEVGAVVDIVGHSVGISVRGRRLRGVSCCGQHHCRAQRHEDRRHHRHDAETRLAHVALRPLRQPHPEAASLHANRH
jgi:hypothetical protein